jgi:hypothetical protein
MKGGSLDIKPTSGDVARKPGGVIELEASWSLPETPRSLTTRLFWFTRGKGIQDFGLVATEPLPGTVRGEQRVKFTLPAAPYSFSGKLVSLVWAVELVADDVEAARWEFVLAPEGTPILPLQPSS